MEMETALAISARGMAAQTSRLRVIAENLANQDTTGSTPGAEGFRRRIITFENQVDRVLGVATVRVKRIGTADGPLPQRFDPSHPAADANGYVKLPNVNSFIEVMDMREAQRSYSANLNVLEASRSMLARTIDLLK